MSDWRKRAKIALTTVELLGNLEANRNDPRSVVELEDAYSHMPSQQSEQIAEDLGNAVQSDHNRPAEYRDYDDMLQQADVVELNWTDQDEAFFSEVEIAHKAERSNDINREGI